MRGIDSISQCNFAQETGWQKVATCFSSKKHTSPVTQTNNLALSLKSRLFNYIETMNRICRIDGMGLAQRCQGVKLREGF